MEPAREAAHLDLRRAELVAGLAQDIARPIASVEPALRHREQIRHRREPLLRAVVQVAPHAPALGIAGLDHTRARASQRGRLMAALELGRGPRREDPHRRDVVLPGRQRPRVHHRHVPEVRAVGRPQADREVALQAHVDRRLGLGEALVSASGKATTVPLHHQRARLARVSYSNGSSIQSPSNQPLITRTCSPPGSDASATNANFASNASAT